MPHALNSGSRLPPSLKKNVNSHVNTEFLKQGDQRPQNKFNNWAANN